MDGMGNAEEGARQPADLVRKALYLAEQDGGNLLLICASTSEAQSAVAWLVGALQDNGFDIGDPDWTASGPYLIAALGVPAGYQHTEITLVNKLRELSKLDPLIWSNLTTRAGVPDNTNPRDPESGHAELLNRVIDREIWMGIRIALRPHKPRPRRS